MVQISCRDVAMKLRINKPNSGASPATRRARAISVSILAFEKGKATPLVATSANEFIVDDEDHTRIAFVRDETGKVTGLILDPGPWELKAAVIAPGAEITARRQ
jgi:hypothetical protein